MAFHEAAKAPASFHEAGCRHRSTFSRSVALSLLHISYPHMGGCARVGKKVTKHLFSTKKEKIFFA